MYANSPLCDLPPLIVLPGLLCDARLFASQIARWPHAVVIDGFYGGADDIVAMAVYALARMPPRAAVLGHSMGARVALEIVRRAPHRVERLALADTGVHAVRKGERDDRYALRRLGRERGHAALVDAWLPGMVSRAAAADEMLMATLRAMSLDAGAVTFDAQVEALLGRPRVDDLLPRIACPTLVVVGEEDRWSPVEQHRKIADAIPGALLRVIAGAGHMAPAEQPQAFNDALAEWLGLAAHPQPTTVTATERPHL